MKRLIIIFPFFFYGLIFGQTTYVMDFNDYPLGSHEAQPSFNLRWSKQINDQMTTIGITSDGTALQGKAFTGMSGDFENYKSFRWDYLNYSAGIASNAISSSANSEVTIRFKFNLITREFCGVVLHRTGPINSANALLVMASSYNGTPSVGYQKWINGSATFYSSTFGTSSWSANTWYYVKVRRNLDTLKIKFWNSSGAEPSSWTGSWMEAYGQGIATRPEFVARGVGSITVDYFKYQDLTVNYALQMTSNLAGIFAKAGQTIRLSWNQTNLDTVGIYYSSDNGQTYKWTAHSLSSTDGSHTYNWTIPSGVISEECFVRLESGSLKDSSEMFTISPDAYIKITNAPVSLVNGTIPDSVSIKFKSVAVDSVNISYSTDSLNWTFIKEHLAVNRAGFMDSTAYKWIPDKMRLHGSLFIRVSEDADTTTVFPVKRTAELTYIGLNAPIQSGYQNDVWYSNPILANGKLFQLSVKTFHWGFYGTSYVYLYLYDKLSRSWKATSSKSWSYDPYLDNAFYADSDNVNLYYFGGEYLVTPGRYFYIQISFSGSDISFHNYDRPNNTAPLLATDPKTYPISDGQAKTTAEYLGRSYYLEGSKIFYSDSSLSKGVTLPSDTTLYADLSGSNAENLLNMGIYAYDNRVMVTSYYNSSGTVPYNYAFKVLPRKSQHFAYDMMRIGDNLIARRNMFRGIYPKARR